MVALLASQTALPSFGQTCLDITLYPFTHLYALLVPSVGPMWANLLSITLICVFLTSAFSLIVYLSSRYKNELPRLQSPDHEHPKSPSPPPIIAGNNPVPNTKRPKPLRSHDKTAQAMTP